MGHVVRRADDPQLFGGERYEEDGSDVARVAGPGAEQARDFHNCRRTRGIVVGAVVNHAGALRVLGTEPASPQMIVMGPDHDRFAAEFALAGHHPDHVLDPPRFQAGVSERWRGGVEDERLEVAVPADGHQPGAAELPRDVGGRGIEPRGPHPAPFPGIVGQVLDVRENARRAGGALASVIGSWRAPARLLGLGR